MNLGLKTLTICAAAASMALADTAGAAEGSQASQTGEEQAVRSVGSERARLGQQRIQAETEARAREEQQRLAEEQERARLGQQRVQAEAEARAREEQQRLAAEEERARLGQQRVQAEAEAREREEQQRLAEEQERARLGQLRIQAEAEAREREEQQRLADEQERIRLAQEQATSSEGAVAPGSPVDQTAAGAGTDTSRTLKQLRSLGELKDDGYITEEEFQRIKQKILDSQT